MIQHILISDVANKDARSHFCLFDDKNENTTKRDVLIMAQNHAYESAGNFCIKGMEEYLLSKKGDEFLHKYRFHILAMTNLYGVYNGLSRISAPRGADLNRSLPQNDSA